MTYVDVISYKFGENEFTSRDLFDLTGNYRSAKLLSDLKFRGLVERVGRGKYRLLKPSERPDSRQAEWNRVKRIILEAPLEKAWAGSNAVEIWTDGKYKVYPNAFLRVFEIHVLESDLEHWKKYLVSHNISYSGRKRVGSYVNLKPKKKLKYDLLNREPVISKSETIKLIRGHRGLYGEADKLID